MRTFFATFAALCFLAGSAFAQSGIDLNPIMTSVVAPLAVTVLSAVASVVLALGFGWLQRKNGMRGLTRRAGVSG